MKKLILIFALFMPFVAFSQDTSNNLSDAEKIYGLSKVWSETKYNFVYYDRLNFDWDSLYQANIPKVLATKSTYDYYQILTRMVAMLHDGHSNVYAPETGIAYKRIPIRVNLIEGKVIVTEVSNDTLKDIKVGDEILEINNVDAIDFAKQNIEPYVSSSTEQDRINRTYYYELFWGNINEPVKLKIKNAGGKIFTTEVSRKMSSQSSTPAITFKLLKDSIGYLSLNSFGEDFAVYKAAFDSLYSQVLLSKSLIIDVRKNGGGNSELGYYTILGHKIRK